MNTLKRNPYIGAQPFQESDRESFFGREQEANELLALALSEQEIVFYAQSGAGKSSLVNTCLIPDLKKKGFEVLLGRVGGDAPAGLEVDNIFVFNLLRSLSTHEVDINSLTRQTISSLLVPAAEDESASAGRVSTRRALIIDQFEEIFSRHHEAWEKRKEFFEQLAQVLEDDPRLRVILVMREDFIALLDPYANLLPGRLRMRYFMQRLEYPAALKAVTEPVKRKDFSRPYDPGAAEKLVDDLRTIKVIKPDGTSDVGVGQFVEPLYLQVICYELWNKLPEGGATITMQNVLDVGDVGTALMNLYANSVERVANAENVSEAKIRKWFTDKLISPGGIRNMVLQEAGETSANLENRVIRALSDLVRAEQRGGAIFYELTHDRLAQPIITSNRIWFEEHLSALQKQAALWDTQGKTDSWLLSDQALVEVEEWAKAHSDELTDTEREFLVACQKLQAQIEEQARSARRARKFNVILGVLIVIAIMATILAFKLRNDALGLKDIADQALVDAETQKTNALVQAQIARSSDLILRAIDNEDKPDLATLLSIEAYYFYDSSARAHKELLNTLQDYAGLQSSWNQPADQILFSPDGKTLATQDKEGITLWKLKNREKLNTVPINEHFNPVYTTAFSPDGKYLASGSSDSSVVFWAVENQQPPKALTEPLKEHTAWVDAVAFSPNGKILASASDDLTIILWDVSDPNKPLKLRVLSGHNAWISSVAFSSDGNTLASGSTDYTVILWDVSDPKKPGKIGEPLAAPGYVWSVAFGKDDQILVTGSGARNEVSSFTLWDISDLENPVQSSEINDESMLGVYAVAFSPVDDEMLAVGGGGSIALWDISDPEDPIQIGEPITEYSEAKLSLFNDYIYSVVFSPDGKALAASTFTNSSNSLILWDVSNPAKPIELGSSVAGRSGSIISSITFNPMDGTRLVTGSRDGSVILWDLLNRKSPVQVGAPQKGHISSPTDMIFNADGSILSSLGDDGTVLVDAVNHSLVGSGSVLYTSMDDNLVVFQYYDNKNISDVIEIRRSTAAGGDVSARIDGKYIAISPTHETIVYQTLDEKGTSHLNLWDIATGKPSKTDITGTYLDFSPDGKLLAYQNSDADENTFINLIGTSKGSSIVSQLQGTYMSISTDGKFVAYLTQDQSGNNLFGLANTLTGEKISDLYKVSPDDYQDDPFDVYLANKTIFYQSYDSETGYNNINLLDMATGITTSALIYEGGIIISPDKKTLIYHTYDLDTSLNYINLLDMDTGLPVGEPQVGTFYKFIPNSRKLIYQFYDYDESSNKIGLIDITTGLADGEPRLGSYIALSSNNKFLVYETYDYSLGDNIIRLLDITTGLALGSTPGGSSYLGFTSDGNNLVYQRSDAIGLMDIATGQIVSEMIIKGGNPLLQPNGNLLATRGENELIYFWDISQTGALGKAIETISVPIQAVTLDPDGKTLAIITENGITLQDLATGKTNRLPFNHHVGGVASAVFSSDGNTLLSVGEDGKSILWDLAEQSIKRSPVISGRGKGFSPNGKVLVVVDEQKQITRFMDFTVVDAPKDTGNPIAGTETFFSPTGEILVVADFVNNKSTLWDLNTLGQIGDPIPGTRVLFSSNGESLAISDGKDSYNTTLWELTTFTQIGEVPYLTDYDPIFSVDGKFFINYQYPDYDGYIYGTAWSLTPPKIAPVRGAADLKGAGLSFSPDGKFLLINYDYYGDDGDDNNDGRLTLLDLTSLGKSNIEGTAPIFSPDGKYLAISNGSSNISIWDLINPASPIISIEGTGPVFSEDSKYLATSDGFNISIWDLINSASPIISIEGTEPVFSKDSKYLAVTVSNEDEESTALLDLPAGEKTIPLAGTNAIFTPDSQFLVNTSMVLNLQTPNKPILEEEAGNFKVVNSGTTLAIYGSKGIRIWDGNELGEPLPGHSGSITQAIFSPDGEKIASIASDGIILTDLTGKKLGETIPGTSISFNSDGTIIAVSVGTNEINETSLWDIADMTTFKLIRETPLPGYHGTFSPDGGILTTSAVENNKATVIWDTTTWEQIGELPGLYSFFSGDSKNLAVLSPGFVSNDKTTSSIISIWDTRSRAEIGKITLENPCSTDFPCNVVAFSPDGKYLAYIEDTNPNDGFLDTYLWDLKTQDKATLGASIKTPGGISDLSFVFENLLIIEGSDGSFTIWEVPSGIPISKPIQGEFQAQVSLSNQDALMYIDEFGRDLILWSYIPQEWASQMCEKVGRNFTPAEWEQIFSNTTTDPYRKTCDQWP